MNQSNIYVLGSINLAREILSPADNIERALSAISRDEEQSQSIKNLPDLSYN